MSRWMWIFFKYEQHVHTPLSSCKLQIEFVEEFVDDDLDVVVEDSVNAVNVVVVEDSVEVVNVVVTGCYCCWTSAQTRLNDE